MVPEGWKHGLVKDLANTVMGYAFKSTDFVPDGIPLLRMGNLYQNMLDLERNPICLPKQYLLDFSRFIVRPGDLVMSMTGTMGKRDYGFTVQIPDSVPVLLLNQRVMKFEPKKDACVEYLLNLFRSEIFLNYLYSFPGGTKQANLSAKQVQELPVLIPPKAEQKKIAKILSIWDKAIATTEKLIANSQQQRKALMQQMLTGKRRFPGFSEEWAEVYLSDLCFINPSRSKKPENGIVSFISMDGVSEDAKLIKTEDRYYSDVSKGFTSFKDDDVLVAKITPCFENGKGAYVTNLTNGIGFGSTEFHVLRAKEGVSAKYIYYLTVMTEFRVRGEMNMQGSAGQKRVTTDYLKSLKLTVPISFTEQNKIATVLTVSDQEIATLTQKLNHLKQEKKALMQQLLTGKRRVKTEAA